MEKSKYGLQDVKSKIYLSEIDRAFDLMDRKDINFNSFSTNNLGVYVFTKACESNMLYQDTTLDDLLSLDSKYDFKIISIRENDNIPYFVRIRNYKKGDFRGEVNYLPPKTVFLEQSCMPNRKVRSEKLPFYLKNGKWICGIKYIEESTSPEVQQCLNIAKENVRLNIILAWEDYFKWRIRAKMPEWDRSIDFYINPANIKKVFKLRDIKDGEQRRKALKHIVRSHERTLSNGEKIEIMRYLRGREKFSQNGYELTIIPSKDDIKTILSKI